MKEIIVDNSNDNNNNNKKIPLKHKKKSKKPKKVFHIQSIIQHGDDVKITMSDGSHQLPSDCPIKMTKSGNGVKFTF